MRTIVDFLPNPLTYELGTSSTRSAAERHVPNGATSSMTSLTHSTSLGETTLLSSVLWKIYLRQRHNGTLKRVATQRGFDTSQRCLDDNRNRQRLTVDLQGHPRSQLLHPEVRQVHNSIDFQNSYILTLLRSADANPTSSVG